MKRFMEIKLHNTRDSIVEWKLPYYYRILVSNNGFEKHFDRKRVWCL